MVCEECGTVQKEDMITSEFQDATGYQSASDHKQIMKDKDKYIRPHSSSRDSYGLTQPLTRINQYARIFNFSPDMLEKVEQMYTLIYREPDVLHKQMTSKETYALACLFIEGRRAQRIFSWKEFCKITGLSPISLSKAVKVFQAKLCIPLDTLTYSEIVTAMTRKHSFSREVAKTAIEILAVCDTAWLITGRNPQILVLASLYIASRALLLERYSNLSFSDFLKQLNEEGYQSLRAAKNRLSEILKVLENIGKTLPWAGKKIKKDFVYHNLTDILKHSKLVFMEKALKIKNDVQVETEDSELCQVNQSEELDISQPPVNKRRKLNVNNENEEPSNLYYCDDSEDLGSDVEKELDALIRTPKEVEEICALREQLPVL